MCSLWLRTRPSSGASAIVAFIESCVGFEILVQQSHKVLDGDDVSAQYRESA
jgi:hypothetical protein